MRWSLTRGLAPSKFVWSIGQEKKIDSLRHLACTRGFPTEIVEHVEIPIYIIAMTIFTAGLDV